MNVYNVFFGLYDQTEGVYRSLNRLILLAKHYIYVSKMNGYLPTLIAFKRFVVGNCEIMYEDDPSTENLFEFGTSDIVNNV